MNYDNLSFGGKADSLVKLSQAGFPVPSFSVIPFEAYQLAKKFDFVEVPEEFSSDLSEVLEKFKDSAVAVRSSANKEDGSSISFAGLFESFLDVRGAEQIEESIKRCWRSTHTERTLKYCERNNLKSDDLAMAVIVQEYIEPDFAGVVFTMNPITGDDSEMIVEACPGSGEKLVSGQVNPSRFTLNRDGDQVIRTAEDRMEISPDQKIMKELREHCARIQALHGRPQDIEFAVKNGRVYILQSRDITKIQFAKDMGEWTTSDFRDGGVSSAVVSPVMWSLYEKIFATTLPEYFVKLKLITAEEAQKTQWYKVFYGRPYWNLRAVKDIQETLPGYNERNFDKDMALPINYEGDGVVTGFTPKSIMKALPVLGALHKEYDLQKRRSEELIAEFHKMESHYRGLDLASLTEGQLKSSLKKLVLEDFTYVESEYFQTIFNASNAKMELSDELKAYKKIDPSIEYVNLISELGDLQVTGPAHFLADLVSELRKQAPIDPAKLAEHPMVREKLAAFAEKYYFHSERELDLLVPRWGEDQRFALETIRSLLAAPKNPVVEAKKNRHLAEIAKMRAAHDKSLRRFIPGAWSGVMKKLERIRYFLWLREEVRDRSTRVYCFIRHHLLEMGRRTGLGEMAFYLSYPQWIAYCDGQASIDDLKSWAAATKAYADGYKHFKNANEIGFRFNNASWAARSQTTNGKVSYFGIGCSAGVIQGRACVIKDISQASKLQQGDIMVVPFTDPGWTPLFSLAAAVVTETGGLLSHAALISREYGLPCVLNLNGATDSIPDGAMIEIDGMEGRVTLL